MAECFQDRSVADRLATAVSAGGTAVLCQVLAGMGGVGKTQLAARYARTRWDTGEVEVLVWVTATSRAAIIDAYTDAAVQVGLAVEPGRPEQAAARFLVWAETTDRPWLVVLDDVQDPADLRGLWPPTRPGGQVLVTTRRRDGVLSGQGRRRIDVGLFTPDEARDYLMAKLAAYDRADDAQEIDGLAEDLGRLPLALAQAVAYMIDQELDCAGYRRLLADRRRTLAEAVPEPGSLPDEHRAIVAAAWSLSIDQADQARPAGLARPLLALVSMLDPNAIPAAVLTCPPALEYLTTHRTETSRDSHSEQPADTADDPSAEPVRESQVYEVLRVLHRFSLIDHDPTADHQQVRVHALIQRATREALTPTWRTAAVRAAADALLAAWPAVERDHLGVILRANTNALHQIAGTLLWQDKAHSVLFRAASSLGEIGQLKAAINEYTRLHHTSHHTLGPDHPSTLTARHNLAHWRGKASSG